MATRHDEGSDARIHTWALHEQALRALRTVIEACKLEGVDVLPVKGVLTARTLYEDVSERPIQDVDLRVRPSDLRRVAHIATRAGWPISVYSRSFSSLGCHVHGVLVEFEAYVGPPMFCALAIDRMIARARCCVDPFGFPHLEPELHDHALLLCVNAFKDKIIEANPGAIQDLILIVQRAGFEPARLAQLARESAVSNVVWIVGDWLARELGAAAWREIRGRIGTRPPRPVYSWFFDRAISARGDGRYALRVLARAGSDGGLRQMATLATTAAYVAETALSRFSAPRSSVQ